METPQNNDSDLVEQLLQRVGDVRDLINQPRLHQQLQNNPPGFYQLCSSLDTLEDTALAIGAYLALEAEDDQSVLYLAVYGVLQVLVVQQKALQHLSAPLKINIQDRPILRRVRDVRNSVVGHPTKRDRANPITYHFLSRSTLSKSSFRYMSITKEGVTTFDEVSTDALIIEQVTVVSSDLREIADILNKIEEQHKEKFRDNKLLDRIPSKANYFFEKLFQGIHDEAEFGQIGLDSVEGIFSNFRKGLEERGLNLDTYDGIEQLFEQVKYPLDELRKFFTSRVKGENPNMDPRAAYIFGDFIQKKMSELKDMASGIDDEYCG